MDPSAAGRSAFYICSVLAAVSVNLYTNTNGVFNYELTA